MRGAPPNVLVAVAAVAAILAGCGDDDVETTTANQSQVTRSTPADGASAESSTEAEQASALAEDAGDIQAAEQAVKEELAGVPLWQGARFHGVAISENEVCVNRMLAKGKADSLGTDRTSHVVVTLPDLTTGEPREGSCGRPRPDPDERLSDPELDALARDLLAANESHSAGGASDAGLRREAARVRRRINNPLPVTTKKANLIQSATAAILAGLRVHDPDQLNSANRYLTEALAK